MKKIINGKKYNTETAAEMGTWSNNCNYGDFSYCSETLYRKRTGEYFLYGTGGAMSKYSQSCGQNSWSGGEDIVPMTESEAKRWAETHLTCEEYESIFGEVEETQIEKTPKVISVQTPFGELMAAIGGDPTYPEIFVYLKRKDGTEIDLTCVTASGETDTVTAYIYGDTEKDDYTMCHEWTNEELNRE